MTAPGTPGNVWKVLGEVPGQIQAEIVRGLLNAQDIEVHLTQEGAGRALGLAVASLGMVQILVPQKDYPAAVKIYAEYLDGSFEDTEFLEEDNDIDLSQ
jgi:hypothetical protein